MIVFIDWPLRGFRGLVQWGGSEEWGIVSVYISQCNVVTACTTAGAREASWQSPWLMTGSNHKVIWLTSSHHHCHSLHSGKLRGVTLIFKLMAYFESKLTWANSCSATGHGRWSLSNTLEKPIAGPMMGLCPIDMAVFTSVIAPLSASLHMLGAHTQTEKRQHRDMICDGNIWSLEEYS